MITCTQILSLASIYGAVRSVTHAHYNLFYIDDRPIVALDTGSGEIYYRTEKSNPLANTIMGKCFQSAGGQLTSQQLLGVIDRGFKAIVRARTNSGVTK